jgi:hypothetical protein
MLIDDETRRFIREHADDDVRKLALQSGKSNQIDLKMALQQIAGRQTARRKLPTWAASDDIVYPPHLNMEQCSSELTARYKASLAGTGNRYVDLTGGFGVDFYWMSQGFKERVYVEQNEQLCLLAEHNYGQLGLQCSVCCCDTATYLTEMQPADVVYLDPARRNEYGGRTYGIEDCTPNVIELLPQLLQHAGKVILKLSPMLDWRKAVADLQVVSEVHIVSVDNECKELVLVLDGRQHANIPICCINNDSRFECVYSLETHCFQCGNTLFPASIQNVSDLETSGHSFLYEPNASIMKAGCFAPLSERRAVRQLSANSHLFVSTDKIVDFPGRRFQIVAISSMGKHELNQSLGSLKSANIAVRNFPMTVEQLRKKLKLKDGGDTYLFATTVGESDHRLFICRKIG